MTISIFRSNNTNATAVRSTCMLPGGQHYPIAPEKGWTSFSCCRWCIRVFFLRWPMANQHGLKLEFYSLDGFLLRACLIHVCTTDFSMRSFPHMTWTKRPTFAPVFVSFFSIIHLFFWNSTVWTCWHLTATK